MMTHPISPAGDKNVVMTKGCPHTPRTSTICHSNYSNYNSMHIVNLAMGHMMTHPISPGGDKKGLVDKDVLTPQGPALLPYSNYSNYNSMRLVNLAMGKGTMMHPISPARDKNCRDA
jgi:hypothetical protein